jgi:hypothetical protein
MNVNAKIGNTDWSLVSVRRNASGACDHCGRTLKNLYVVRNDTTDKTMTVGTGCCKKVTGWTLALAEAQRILWYAAKTIERAAAWAHFAELFPEVAEHITRNPQGSHWRGEIVDSPETIRSNFAADYRRRMM